MKKYKRLLAFSIIALTLVSAIFAVGDKEKAAVDTPKLVIVYSSVDEGNAKKILDAFTADTGITAQFVHLSTGPALARLKAEAANPQADVWMGAPSENHASAKNDGLTIPHTGGNFASLDKKFKDAEGYWRSFYMNPMALAINKDILARQGASMPKSWNDLLKPEYKGQIQLPSPQTAGTGYNLLASFVLIMGEEKAYDYMKKLAPNVQTYTSSGTAPSQGVAVGQSMIGIQFTPAFFEFIDKGHPLEVVFPSEGVSFEAPAVSIVKDAKNLKAAQALVEWLTSPNGQAILSKASTYFYPVTPGVPLGKGMPAFETLKTVTMDTAWASAEKKRLVDRWVSEVLPVK
ncbi:ABC transporter substrate-binding protein [Spirochaetota bacterium]